MVLAEIMIGIGNFLVNICSGVAGNLVTEPLFRRFPARKKNTLHIEAVDVNGEPTLEAFNTIWRVLSEYMFRRKIFEVKDFKRSHSKAMGITTQLIDVRSIAAQKLTLLMDKGVFIALNTEKLRTLSVVLCMRTGDVLQPIERVRFDFSHGEGMVPKLTNEIITPQDFHLEDVLNDMEKYINNHDIRRGAYTVLIELCTLKMEAPMPFFQIGSALGPFVEETQFSQMSSTLWEYQLSMASFAPGAQKAREDIASCSSMASTPAERGKQKIDESTSSIQVRELYVARLDI